MVKLLDKPEGLTLTLPYPVSVNQYWGDRVIFKKTKEGKPIPICSRYVSKRGKQFKKAVINAVRKQYPNHKAFKGRIRLFIVVCPPTNRKFDLDNIQKSLLDALEDAHVFLNDNQVDEIVLVRGKKDPSGDGYADVKVSEI